MMEEKLLNEFLGNLESHNTLKCYKRDIIIFESYLQNNFSHLKSFLEIDRTHALSYKKWLLESDQAPKSINRKLSSLSAFYRFLMDQNMMDRNPLEGIKRPRQEVLTQTLDLTDAEVVLLIEKIKSSKSSSSMHLAILFLLFSTGLRKSEVLHLKFKDLKLQGKPPQLTVKTKGQKVLTKVLHPSCVIILENYIKWMKSLKKNTRSQDYVFRPSNNPLSGNLEGPLNPKSLDYILKSWAKRAGIFKRLSPHSARATYIGSALEQGVDIYKLAQDVGHSSVKTTEEYNKRKRQLKDSPVYSIGFLKNISA